MTERNLHRDLDTIVDDMLWPQSGIGVRPESVVCSNRQSVSGSRTTRLLSNKEIPKRGRGRTARTRRGEAGARAMFSFGPETTRGVKR